MLVRRKDVVRRVNAMLIAGVAVIFALSACSGPKTTPPPEPEPTATVAPTTVAPTTVAPTTVAPTTVAPTTPPTTVAPPTATPPPDQAALIARGAAVVFATAGGVGCAYCHGADLKGSQGYPPLRGTGITEKKLRFALDGGVQIMNFLNLPEEDIVALWAYLKPLQ